MERHPSLVSYILYRWTINTLRKTAVVLFTSDTEAQVVTNYTRHSSRPWSSYFALQKQERLCYVMLCNPFYLTPTGLMFPRVIDLIDIDQ